MENWQFYVAGVKHHHLPVVIDMLCEGDLLELVPEPTNVYDQYAVRIQHDSTMLGYVPKKISEQVTSWLQEQSESERVCTIIKLEPENSPWNMLMVRIGGDEE